MEVVKMLKENVVKLLNDQVSKEFYSAYLYLDFSNFYLENGLDGFANWYKVQAHEELNHALLFIDYLHKNNVNVILDKIPKPTQQFKDFKEPLVAGLKHEQYITNSINTIFDLAASEKDFATQEFLNWFVKEQAQEEKAAGDLILKFELYGYNPESLYALDKELAQRKYEGPSLKV